MLVVAGLILAEKVLPFGWQLARVFAVAFVFVGIWVAAAPSSVPGLARPDSAQAMRAMGMPGMRTGTGVQKIHHMPMKN